jgi:hypothetical protein
MQHFDNKIHLSLCCDVTLTDAGCGNVYIANGLVTDKALILANIMKLFTPNCDLSLTHPADECSFM